MRCPYCNKLISEFDIKHCKLHDISLDEWRKLLGIRKTAWMAQGSTSFSKPHTGVGRRALT